MTIPLDPDSASGDGIELSQVQVYLLRVRRICYHQLLIKLILKALDEIIEFASLWPCNLLKSFAECGVDCLMRYNPIAILVLNGFQVIHKPSNIRLLGFCFLQIGKSFE